MTTAQRQIPLVIEPSSEQVSEPSRRRFCAHACQAASLVAVSALLPACGGGGDDGGSPTSPTTPVEGQALAVLNGTVSGRTVTVTASGALASANGAALVNAPIQPPTFLVFRSSTTTVQVLTAICTHEGCTVDHFNGQLYVCPCHGSKYTTAGAVANGPANRALTSYPATLSGDQITFTV